MNWVGNGPVGVGAPKVVDAGVAAHAHAELGGAVPPRLTRRCVLQAAAIGRDAHEARGSAGLAHDDDAELAVLLVMN